MNPRYPLVASRAGHRCEYCHAPEVVFNFPFEVEHVVPLSRNGEDHEYNWALSCRSCNLRKASRLDAIDPDSGESVRLYHPRRDRWEDHFEPDLEAGEITGRTAVGRATVSRLEMNSPTQLMARRHWQRLEIFP